MPQTTAIRNSLKSLFKEKRLPDNPYYFLANVLGAYVDQSSLWREPAAQLVAVCDLDGGVEVVDATSRWGRGTWPRPCAPPPAHTPACMQQHWPPC